MKYTEYKRVTYKSPMRAKAFLSFQKLDDVLLPAERRLSKLDQEYRDWLMERVCTLLTHSKALEDTPDDQTLWQAISDISYEIRGTASSYSKDLAAEVAEELHLLTRNGVVKKNIRKAQQVIHVHTQVLLKLQEMEGKVTIKEIDPLLRGLKHAISVVLD